ncbi:hypothetical protein ABZW30_08095 [Kitasatospora sp. NPDC004669]|uniref:hypothetical protein n=1 Tax=Kitasatospora sp. NPDC004669 TaxID=3154555 RepID=UPI0033BE3645
MSISPSSGHAADQPATSGDPLPDSRALAQHTARALHILAPPGTVRVLLGARYWELPKAERRDHSDASADMEVAEVRAHLRRLQQHGLLTRTSSHNNIHLQATTEAARQLWSVWTAAVSLAGASHLLRTDEHIAVPIEATLRLADHPTTLAVIQTIRHSPTSPANLAAALTSAGAAQLPDHLPELERAGLLRRDDQDHLTATVSGRRLATLYDALGSWYRTTLGAETPATAKAARTRTIPAAASANPPTAQPPATSEAGKPRSATRR